MIDLYFKGQTKDQKVMQSFANEVLTHLFPREFKRNITVGIRFRNRLSGGAFGYAEIIDRKDDVYLVEVANNVFDGENWVPVTRRELAATLIHELVHIRQYIRRELNESMTRWKGQEVPYGPRGGLKIPYHKQPWEAEAFKIEKELVKLLW